ncbi:MAG: HD domain-containing protein [Bacteroidia bacterium]|nr:HD domain-containing protein [Bacteroidia bacterium]
MSDRRTHSHIFEEKIDALISPFERRLGKHYLPYRNHVHRVANLTWALKHNSDPDDVEKIAIAAVYHDIGIWTDSTFDYLDPSRRMASSYLSQAGKSEWNEEIASMIDMHHKITSYKGPYRDNVEAFRKADLLDLSFGKISFGLERRFIRENYRRFPLLNFHLIILSSFFRHFLKHPLNPLPMMKK